MYKRQIGNNGLQGFYCRGGGGLGRHFIRLPLVDVQVFLLSLIHIYLPGAAVDDIWLDIWGVLLVYLFLGMAY